MLRSKAFTKITKKGAVVKVVKEHYLRDDIPCGLKACQAGCNDSIKISPEDDRPGPLVLLLDPQDDDCRLLTLPQRFILVPDTNIFLHHMDVMEGKVFCNVVVLQTVLEEVRNRSPNIYQRVRSLVNRPEKRFFVFSNEHHRDCFAGAKSGGSEAADNSAISESDNDRNDRAIRMATAWYQKHLNSTYPGLVIAAVLLTNDYGNREKALQEGLKAFDLKSLVEFIPLEYGKLGIQDMIDASNSNNNSSDMMEDVQMNEFEYPEHLSEAALKEGVASGKYYRGTLQASPFNPFKGSISTGLEGELATIYLPDRLHMNRAIQGDQVVVEVLKRSEWTSISSNNLEEDEDEGNVNKSAVIDGEITLNEGIDELRVVGRVLGILQRKQRAYVGSIDRKSVRPDAPCQTLLFFPMDRRIPRIRIRTRQATNLVGKRILVSVDNWDRHAKNPTGHFVKDLGMAGDRATEIAAILLEHDVSTLPFTPAQLAELPKEGDSWQVRPEDIVGRADFRHLDICSIDPPGCTDIDDALHARPLDGEGFIEVGVHIADVTTFVRANGAIDREAASRATTVYLVDRRIDMLPGLLGSNLCSLQGGKERLTFSVVWKIDPLTAEIRHCSFARSVIKSRAALTYDQAQERLDKGTPESDDAVTRSIHLLAGIARKLKAKRIEAGALTLASPEVRFNLDTTTANPVDVQVKEMKEANSLVEEFMLLANISVAEKLLEAFPDTALLRRHPTPPIEAFNGLNKALAPFNLSLDPSSSKSLAESLDLACVNGDDFFNRLVRIMTTRCMYQAQYFAAGTLDRPLYWHYGLAAPLYTHFTSPIRRYADVLVHRLLAVAIEAPGAASVGLAADKTVLSDVCDNLNYRNRMAQQAQRASIDLFTILFFRGKVVHEEAYVIRLMKSSLVALVPKYGMECVVDLSDQMDRLTFDPEKIVFYSSNDKDNNDDNNNNSKVVYRLFQPIRIKISVLEHEASLRERLVVKIDDSSESKIATTSNASPKRKLNELDE